MNYGFNRDQLQQDLKDFREFMTGFGKSFLPSAKKAQGKQLGFFEEMYIRFRIELVNMGISKIIRLVIALVVAVILWITVFRNAMTDVRMLLIFGFIVFYGWLMNEHLIDKGKPVDTTAQIIVGVHEFGVGVWDGVTDFFSGIINHLLELILPPKKNTK